MKILKTFLKILGILLIVIVVAIFAVPTLFRGKIETLAKNIINENVNATVNFNNLSISLIRDFPNARVSLEDLVVVGTDKFEGDTLATLSSFSTSVSLWSLIKGEFDIKSIIIDEPYVQARVLADGSANWDIVKSDSDEDKKDEETSETDKSSSNFSLSLKKLQVKKANIVYDDDASKTLAGIKNLDLTLKGDFSESQTDISLTTQSEGVSLYDGSSAIVSNLALAIKADIDADIANNIYTLKDNEIKANGMALTADGVAKLLDEGMDFDLTYGLKVPSLKSLLALIPPSIVAEVKDIDTKGDLSMSGYVKGLYNKKSMPVITLALSVKNGYAKYSGFNEAINNINVELDMLLDKNKDANSLINLSGFGFTVANNPFSMSGKVTLPFTDPNMALSANGKIDFTSLKKCMPLTDTALEGLLNADIVFAGTMSQIEKEQYDKIKLSGNLELNSFKMKMEGFEPEIELNNASLTFNPSYCALNSFDAKMGNSDLQMNGRLDNLLPYVFKGSELKGTLALKSTQIDCNELVGSTPTDAAEADETSQEQNAVTVSNGVIVLPSNVDFKINANIGKLIYDNLSMTNAAGQVALAKGKLDLSRLTMNALSGNMNLGGWYFAQDENKANTNMQFSLANVDVADLAKTFDIFGKFAPMLKNMKGKATVALDFSSAMVGDMNIDYKTLNATGTIRTDSLTFLSNESLEKLAALLKTDKLQGVKNLNLNFAIRNGMLTVNPFDVKIGNYTMKIGGEQGIAGDLNYVIDVDLPAGKIGTELNNSLAKLGIGAGGSSKVKVGVKVGGNLSSPTFGLTTPKYGGGATSIAGDAVSNVKETAAAAIDSAKTVAKEKIETAVDSVKNIAKDKVTNKLKDLLNKR